jgi:hypothetical protein
MLYDLATCKTEKMKVLHADSLPWKQWKRIGVRFVKLRQRNIGAALAAQTVGSSHGPWRIANSPALSLAFPMVYFDALGLPRLLGSA